MYAERSWETRLGNDTGILQRRNPPSLKTVSESTGLSLMVTRLSSVAAGPNAPALAPNARAELHHRKPRQDTPVTSFDGASGRRELAMRKRRVGWEACQFRVGP